MASLSPNNRTAMYPEVIRSNPSAPSPVLSNPNSFSSPHSSLYPTIDMNDLVGNLFPDNYRTSRNAEPHYPSAPVLSVEEVLITVPGAILHLIDKQYSVELACGDFSIVRLRQGDNFVAVLARVSHEIQWPLAKDEAIVKLDDSHYFFSFRAPRESGSDLSDDEGEKVSANDSDGLLNYGLTFASKGQDGLLRELDAIFEHYGSFSVQKVSSMGKELGKESEVLDGSVAKEVSPEDLKSEKKKEMMEERCAAYWTTLAPNVEDYSGTAARLIASGSAQLIKGILWCGDVTIDRLKKGNEVLKQRMTPGTKADVSPETMRRIRRVKRVTKMSEKVAVGVLSGVLKVSGLFTSSVVNSRVGKKFFSLLPGEIVLASLDGFSKVCDAVEVAGKNVMSTSSTVTTGLVSHRYGEEAAKATSEGLDAAGHALGAAWAVLKLRKALNPKSALRTTTLAKSAAKTAAAEMKAKTAAAEMKAKISK